MPPLELTQVGGLMAAGQILHGSLMFLPCGRKGFHGNGLATPG